jgi:hypothetical protein
MNNIRIFSNNNISVWNNKLPHDFLFDRH